MGLTVASPVWIELGACLFQGYHFRSVPLPLHRLGPGRKHAFVISGRLRHRIQIFRFEGRAELVGKGVIQKDSSEMIASPYLPRNTS